MSSPTLTAGREHSVAELEDLAFELRSKLLQLCGTYEGAVHIGGDLSAAVDIHHNARSQCESSAWRRNAWL